MSVQGKRNVSLGGWLNKSDVLNQSTAKQAFSFGQGDRFPSVRKASTDGFQKLPSTLQKRGAGFGIGNRFQTPQQMRDRSNSPPCNVYNLSSDFDVGRPGTSQSQQKSGIYSFGVSRDKFHRVYMPNRLPQDQDIPGPGSYDVRIKKMGTEGRRTTMHSRHKQVLDPYHIMTKQNVPGPGCYGSVVEMNKQGVYNLSTISNSRAAKWSPSKKRFHDEAERLRKLIPGPGQYNPIDYKSGNYLLSNFKNYGTKKYMNSNSKTDKYSSSIQPLNDTPGPGQYQAPSDFGYVELKKFVDLGGTSRRQTNTAFSTQMGGLDSAGSKNRTTRVMHRRGSHSTAKVREDINASEFSAGLNQTYSHNDRNQQKFMNTMNN